MSLTVNMPYVHQFEYARQKMRILLSEMFLINKPKSSIDCEEYFEKWFSYEAEIIEINVIRNIAYLLIPIITLVIILFFIYFICTDIWDNYFKKYLGDDIYIEFILSQP